MKRRFFLRGAGGAMLAAPSLTSLIERGASAQTTLPQRLAIFFSPNGCITNRWFPDVEDGPLDAKALKGTSIESLTPYVDKLLIPRGLTSVNKYGMNQSIDPKIQCQVSKLTCALVDEDWNALASSLDHQVAAQINPNGASPLVLSAGPIMRGSGLSFSAASTPHAPFTTAKAAFADLTRVAPGEAGGPVLATYGVKRQASVIDAVRDDLDSYQRLNMSVSDTQRIDDWLQLLRETEVPLTSTICETRSFGLTTAALEEAGDGTDLKTAFTIGADMMINVMALNMLCDTNRSMLLTFPSYPRFKWNGIDHDSDHAGLSRRSGDYHVGADCLPNALDMITEIDVWYARKYQSLVAVLDGIPEGDGTLLDNTATMWLPEFSDGNGFSLNNLPIIIAGSLGGALKQGAAVNVEGPPIGPGNSEGNCYDESDRSNPLNTGSERGHVPINKLYVTLMNALGCTTPEGTPLETFGVFDSDITADGITDPGELSQLRAG